MNTKICRKCSQVKTIGDFHKNPKSRDGHQSNCKDCANQYAKNYRLTQDKNKQREYDFQYYETNKETILNTKKQYYQENKDYKLIYGKQYYQENKEDKLEYNKQYYEENKEIIKQQTKRYAREHKQETKIYHNQYYKEKRKNDPNFQLRSAISANINYGLKSNGGSKSGQTYLEYLEYTIPQLWEHLISHFGDPVNLKPDGQIWMTQNNYGKYDPKTWFDNDPSTWKWSVDHIKPQSEFAFTSMEDQGFKDCWALSNLRPLSAKQNWLDGINRTRHNK